MSGRIIITRDMIEETFNGAAPLYDGHRMFKESGQLLVAMLPIKPGYRALDIACGTGAVTLPAARRVGPDGHVTGIDISGNMLQQAVQEAEKEGLNNIEFLRMDAEHLEFPDASFDIVTCAFALFYFPRTALAEMYRVLKPGGTIGLGVFETMTPDPGSPGIIVNRLIKEYGEKDPDALFARFQYAWPTRFSVEQIESLLIDYGFHKLKSVRETKDAVYKNVEDFWEMLFSGGSRLTFSHMDEKTLVRFKTDLQDRLSTVMQPDGIHFAETALFTVAKR